jgi:glycosyltransferase involved in cell wall biosynthesis
MSVGVPVISSNAGGLKEVVDRESGYIALNNTPKEYFQILKSIFEGDRSFENKIIIAHQKVRLNFSKDCMLKKIHEIYQL